MTKHRNECPDLPFRAVCVGGPLDRRYLVSCKSEITISDDKERVHHYSLKEFTDGGRGVEIFVHHSLSGGEAFDRVLDFYDSGEDTRVHAQLTGIGP